MKTEPYKVDVKNLLLKGSVGDTEEVSIDKGLTLAMDEENVLKRVQGKLKLTLLDDEILAEFEIRYAAKTVCARCLKKFGRKGEVKFDREYLIGKRVAENDELLVDKEFKIETGKPIAEEIAFDVPMKPLCNTACKGLS